MAIKCTLNFRPATERLLQRALTKAKIPFTPNIHIGRYEVDFLVEPLIVIEVDGYVHCIKDVINKDKRKNLALEYAGYRVLRFTGDEVKYDIRSCVKTIKNAIICQNNTMRYGRPIEQMDSWKQVLHEAYLQ